jgi:hypothetical protein
LLLYFGDEVAQPGASRNAIGEGVRAGTSSPEDGPISGATESLNPALSLGMRVRLDGAPINTTLTTPVGTIVAEDRWDTYIVRLDLPAVYRNEDGTEQSLDEIRVISFNLMPIN